MTSDNHEFLILNCTEMDFIINRNQFFASIVLEETVKYKSQARHFSSLMKYHEQTLPVFDFNAFLKDTFGSGIESIFNIALISDITLFSEGNQSAYRNLILKENTELSSEYLALKVNVQAEIKRVPLSEIRLIPSGLRAKLNKEGILGCRFPLKNNIQYFVDIETIIFKCIEEV
ncbi:hypothetical protein QUF80_07695 [Desulfococcaceae bacterium HSG8]|nr:hypothetical protein [Desulfococcaceae bacterium HSG8]